MMAQDPVARFERAFADRVGSTDAIAVTFARLGLRHILHGLGLVPGDEVILSPLTCRVVVLALQSAGYRPAYADIAAGSSLNIDAEAVTQRWNARSRAIVFQHTYGVGSGLEAVADVARRRGVPLIEDCAHCMPASNDAMTAGTRGVAAIWSLNYRKPIPAGAGGLVTTSDEVLARRIRKARDAGMRRSIAAELGWRMQGELHARVLRPSTYWMLWGLQRRFRGDEQATTLTNALQREVESLPARISQWQARRGLKSLSTADARARRSRELSHRYADALAGSRTLSLLPDAS
ncbi:MAG TPA: DegT/DnrJ/EryC1/StrS family aminotransferase, partial [Gemmatimonadaceae bacterium]